MQNKLLPCPFCGGEAELQQFGSIIPYSFISCKECGCRQAESISKEAVINAWNTRKPMERIVEQLEESLQGAKDSKDLSKYSAYQQAIAIVRNGGKE